MSNFRVDFEENCYYHIFNRWFQKQIIFRNKQDYKRFYQYVIKELKSFKGVKLIAYSFLPNHFHFIIKNLETGLNISEFMRKVQGSYATFSKNKYSETGLILKGQFFEWRFKAKLINNENYLEKCLVYVIFNPVKHGIVDKIEDYKYTSYHQLNNKLKYEYDDFILDTLEY